MSIDKNSGITYTVAQWQQVLNRLIEKDNYLLAAHIRDAIRDKPASEVLRLVLPAQDINAILETIPEA